MVALLSGEITFNWANYPGARPHIQSGRLLALAMGNVRRAPTLPTVPTTAESGLPGFEAALWDAVMVPTGTAPAIVERLNAEINKILRRPDIDSSWRKQGADPIVMTTAEFDGLLRMEIERWEKVIKTNGIKGE